jgi:hypothetical protein
LLFCRCRRNNTAKAVRTFAAQNQAEVLEALGLSPSLSLAKVGRKASMEQTAGRKIVLSSEQVP